MLVSSMVLLQANPSSSQSNANQHADSEPFLMMQDQIHVCHCMSLLIASQNTQCYLQAGCRLACAVASAKIALFAEAWSLQFDHALFCDLPFVQQLLILNTLFLWLQPTDLDKQGL